MKQKTIADKLADIIKRINQCRHADNAVSHFIPDRTNDAIDIGEKALAEYEASKVDDGELKACPFCGGKAEWSKGKYGDGSDWHHITCGECECIQPHVSNDIYKSIDSFKEQSIKVWDERSE